MEDHHAFRIREARHDDRAAGLQERVLSLDVARAEGLQRGQQRHHADVLRQPLRHPALGLAEQGEALVVEPVAALDALPVPLAEVAAVAEAPEAVGVGEHPGAEALVVGAMAGHARHQNVEAQLGREQAPVAGARAHDVAALGLRVLEAGVGAVHLLGHVAHAVVARDFGERLERGELTGHEAFAHSVLPLRGSTSKSPPMMSRKKARDSASICSSGSSTTTSISSWMGMVRTTAFPGLAPALTSSVSSSASARQATPTVWLSWNSSSSSPRWLRCDMMASACCVLTSKLHLRSVLPSTGGYFSF